MTGYEKLLKILRDEVHKMNADKNILLGTMTSEKTCNIGDIELDEDDLYMAENLLHNSCEKVDISISSTWNVIDNSTYTPKLAAGDMVLLLKINDEKYIIVSKVVSINVSV